MGHLSSVARMTQLVSPSRPEVVAQMAVARLVCRPDDWRPAKLCCKLFYLCPQPISMFFWAYHLCLAPSASKVTHFSPNRHHPFLKHVHTIAVSFFIPPLLCCHFLTAVLILRKIVYPLFSHCVSVLL